MMRLQARLNTRMGILYTKGLLYTLSVFIGKHGPSTLFDALENIQPGMGMMLLDQVWLPSVLKVRGAMERKAISIGMTRILCELPQVQTNHNLWIKVLTKILQLFEEKEEVIEAKDPDAQLVDLEEMGYEAGFSKLCFTSSKEKDYMEHIQSAKHFLTSSLSTLSSQTPNVVSVLRTILMHFSTRSFCRHPWIQNSR